MWPRRLSCRRDSHGARIFATPLLDRITHSECSHTEPFILMVDQGLRISGSCHGRVFEPVCFGSPDACKRMVLANRSGPWSSKAGACRGVPDLVKELCLFQPAITGGCSHASRAGNSAGRRPARPLWRSKMLPAGPPPRRSLPPSRTALRASPLVRVSRNFRFQDLMCRRKLR